MTSIGGPAPLPAPTLAPATKSFNPNIPSTFDLKDFANVKPLDLTFPTTVDKPDVQAYPSYDFSEPDQRFDKPMTRSEFVDNVREGLEDGLGETGARIVEGLAIGGGFASGAGIGGSMSIDELPGGKLKGSVSKDKIRVGIELKW
jgi:hypothetical protein